MNTKNTGMLTGWIIMAFFAVMSTLGCKKDGPTRAVISVLDSAGHAVQGAKVTLWQDTVTNSSTGVKSEVRVTRTTDASGKADFEFALEAFLNIEAIKNTDTGRSFIRLKEHETVTQTVHL